MNKYLGVLLSVFLSLGILFLAFEIGNSIYKIYIESGFVSVVLSFVIGLPTIAIISKIYTKFSK